jgi:transglycosylase-like protein with SLT domain
VMRKAKWALLAVAAPVVACGVLVAGSLFLLGGGGRAQAGGSILADAIPEPFRTLYHAEAAACPGLAWTILAGVGFTESHHGTDARASSAGAMGPMQIMPATFAAYGEDADGDGLSILDPEDAVRSARKQLCANGAGNPLSLVGALAVYGSGDANSQAGKDYAGKVVAAAAVYAATGPAVIGTPGLTLSDNARADLEEGIDPRLASVLATLARIEPIEVGGISCKRSGHDFYVDGTHHMSNHCADPSRAADITKAGGAPVSPTNRAAWRLVAAMSAMSKPQRPEEVGSPFTEFDPLPGQWFTDRAHMDHLHVGFDSVAK